MCIFVHIAWRSALQNSETGNLQRMAAFQFAYSFIKCELGRFAFECSLNWISPTPLVLFEEVISFLCPKSPHIQLHWRTPTSSIMKKGDKPISTHVLCTMHGQGLP